MSVDRLAERIRTALAGKKITEQVMFGGICFMFRGNMTVGASPRGLLVRVGKEGNAAALKRKGARQMIQGDRTMLGYLFVDEQGTRSDKDLAGWIDIAVAHVATLPAKKKAAPKKSRKSG